MYFFQFSATQINYKILWISLNYQPQRSWAKGNIFTSVCQEFCPPGGGGCLPQCMLGYTPPPPSRHPTPGKQTAAYGQRAAGTHPTGMHSCMIMCPLTCTCSSLFCFRLLSLLLQPNKWRKYEYFYTFWEKKTTFAIFCSSYAPAPPPPQTNSHLVKKISVPSVPMKLALLKALTRFDVVTLQFQIPDHNTESDTDSKWLEWMCVSVPQKVFPCS